eukprot:465454_1
MSFDHLNLGQDDKVRKILQKHADGIYDEIILYSNRVTKINKKSKAQERVLVITDKAIYNFTPAPVKSRSFSIKQFMKNPYDAKEVASPKRSHTGRARASVHTSLKAQPQHEIEAQGVGQMKRRIVLKQVHTISVSSHVNEIVLHVPNEYDYLYRLATFQDVEEVVRVLQDSSQAVKHFPKAYQFELDSLVPISDNAKSRKKGNETQDQYMARKLKQWQRKYKVVSYDVKSIIKPQKRKKKKKTLNHANTMKLQQPYKSRAVSIAPGPINTNQNPYNRPQRAITNYNAGPTNYFTNFPNKTMHAAPVSRGSVYTPPTTSSHQYAQSMVNSNNLLQLQAEFPPPSASSDMPPQSILMHKAHTHHGAPPRPPHHRQVYSESFSTNPQYAQRMQRMGAMAYNQHYNNNAQGTKKKHRRHSHSESSCGSSCSCSSGSETGSSYTRSGSTDTGSGSSSDYDGSTTYTATVTAAADMTPHPTELHDLGMLIDFSLDTKKPCKQNRHKQNNTMHILPSKTAITPKNRSPIPFEDMQAIVHDTHEAKEEMQDEEAMHAHNLSARSRRNQKRKNHSRYARTQTLPYNVNNHCVSPVSPVKQMPTRALPNVRTNMAPKKPLPQNNNNNNNTNNNQWKRNGACPPQQPNMSMSRSWTPTLTAHGANNNYMNSNNTTNRHSTNNQWNGNMNNNLNVNMNQAQSPPNIPQVKCVSSILEAKQLPVHNKEAYLPDNLFWDVFKMTKAQFYSLRGWKQKKMKRDTGFF